MGIRHPCFVYQPTSLHLFSFFFFYNHHLLPNKAPLPPLDLKAHFLMLKSGPSPNKRLIGKKHSFCLFPLSLNLHHSLPLISIFFPPAKIQKTPLEYYYLTLNISGITNAIFKVSIPRPQIYQLPFWILVGDSFNMSD